MNRIKYDITNKYVWNKVKIYFKNENNNTNTLIMCMPFKIKKILIKSNNEIFDYNSINKLNNHTDKALKYCILKSNREQKNKKDHPGNQYIKKKIITGKIKEKGIEH